MTQDADLTGVQQNLGKVKTDEYITRTHIVPLLRDEKTRKRLIEEHARNPIGIPGQNGQKAVGHSEDLQRVIDKFRRHPQEGKLVRVCTKPHREWRIGRLTGVRGDLPELLDGTYESEDEAEHAIFLLRIDELLAEYKD